MIQFVLAQESASPQAGAFGLLPIVLIVLIFYFLMYRPMRKRQKALESMINGLQKGDRVITNGGLYGTISDVNRENTFVLKVADNTQVEVAKNAIASKQAMPESGS
jgi:preprotein translocase subunit YajC